MAKRAKPLVDFNASYYVYPNSIRSYKYLIETSLSTYDQSFRMQWIERVNQLTHSDFHRIVSAHFSDVAYNELLYSLIAQHGIFVEKFFHQGIHEQVARYYAKLEIGCDTLQNLISDAWGRSFRLHGKSDAIYRIIDHIFEQAIVAAINVPQTFSAITEWFDKFSKPISCGLCGNTFRTIDLPDWIYFGSNGYKHCCFRCQKLEAPKKADLFALIPAFIEKCGFIPNSSVNPINYAFTSRLSNNQWAGAISAYARIGGIEHVKMKFGSWFKALAETGALPEGVQTTARGIRCLAKDGHVCFSLDEQRIDDWLTVHQIDHEREPIYPLHPRLNSNGKRRADWKVRDTLIEYFGLIGDSKYEIKMEEKIILAQQLNINLVAVYPSDLNNLNQCLGSLLK